MNFVTPVSALRLKSNTKPWFDINFSNPILINNKKKLQFEEKTAENKNNLKNFVEL